MSDEAGHPEVSEQGARVLEVLEAAEHELPVVVIARMTGIQPTKLRRVLDDLHDAGLVDQGSERATVRLVRARGAEGRFDRSNSEGVIRK